MYNLRYHIASLVAVFLALSLGLLLGGISVQSGALSRQRAALVNSLRGDFTKLSGQNQTLKEDLNLEKRLGAAMVDDAISGRLEGERVLVLANTGKVEGLSATEAAIRAAGGVPTLLTLRQPRLGLEEAKVASTVASAIDVEQGSDVLAAAAEALAREWSKGTPGPATQALSEAQVFDAPEVPPSGFDGVVNLATFDGKADAGGIAVATALQRVGVPAVAAQMRSSTSGLASAANAAGLSALDTMGTSAGRYTLVMLLSGAEPGYYGVAQGTAALFPAPAGVR